MSAFVAFLVGPLALLIGLLALAATVGWTMSGEIQGGGRGDVLVKRATSAVIPLLGVLAALLVLRLLVLS